jgi:hypothetical protein
MKDKAEPVDLARLWRELGVGEVVDGAARLDDIAPLAALRRSIAS